MTSLNQSVTQSPWQTHRRLALMTFIWLVSVALMTFAQTVFPASLDTFGPIVLLLNVVAGLALLLTNTAFLRALDELQRKIQIDAMAVTLGYLFIGGFAIQGAVKLELMESLTFGNFLASGALVYVFTCWWTARRYG